MCEFISWIEKDGKCIFLTGEDVFKTKRGKELQAHDGTNDLDGHGAIRWYYNFEGGLDKECTDFSTPDNFPLEIVKAIKSGKMRGLGIAEGLLTPKVITKYKRILQSALAEYDRMEQSAYAECKEIAQSALAEYEKIQLTFAEYEKIKQSALAFAEYEKIQQSAFAKYKKIQQPARVKYEKIEQLAYAEYKKTKQSMFWDLFAVKKNRVKKWR